MLCSHFDITVICVGNKMTRVWVRHRAHVVPVGADFCFLAVLIFNSLEDIDILYSLLLIPKRAKRRHTSVENFILITRRERRH